MKDRKGKVKGREGGNVKRRSKENERQRGTKKVVEEICERTEGKVEKNEKKEKGGKEQREEKRGEGKNAKKKKNGGFKSNMKGRMERT